MGTNFDIRVRSLDGSIVQLTVPQVSTGIWAYVHACMTRNMYMHVCTCVRMQRERGLPYVHAMCYTRIVHMSFRSLRV